MAAPSLVNLTAGTITVVAANITSGKITISNPNPKTDDYLWSYVLNLAAAPADLTTFVPFEGESVDLSFSAASDVYVYCKRTGRVRVDL